MSFKYKPRAVEELDKRSTQQGSDFIGFIKDEFRTYSPKKGDNAIRILPPTWEDAEHYGFDVWVHYSVGPDNATVLCPFKMANERCPICDDRVKAERKGDEEGARELKANRRVLVWLIDRKDDKEGPVLWAMPWTVDRDITKVSKDKATGKYYFIDSPDEGFDIYFDKEGEKMLTKYTGMQLARRATSVPQEIIDYIVESPVTDCLIFRDYDEIKTLYEGGSASSTEDDTPSRSAPKEQERAKEREPEEERRPAPREEPREDRDPPKRVELRGREPEEAKEAEQPASSGKTTAQTLRERFGKK